MTFFSKHKRCKTLLMASTAVTIPFIMNIPQAEASSSTYDDFNSEAYWADDMQWMIDEGLITGYINQKHRTTKIVGNWLDPNGMLTEYQMLSILLRYDMGVSDYKVQSAAGAKTGSTSYWHYLKAKELGITTKGSTTNNNYANAQVTRGQLAQAIVSMHYGKYVPLRKAIIFMYANKLTTGTNPSEGETMDNFAPETKLSRAHISAFLHRYENLKASGNVFDTLNYSDTTPNNTGINGLSDFEKSFFALKTKTKATDDVVGNKIKTKFGERAYNAVTQDEYDNIMGVLDTNPNLKTAGLQLSVSDEEKVAITDAYNQYMNGKRAITVKSDPQYRTMLNNYLKGIEHYFSLFGNSIKSVDDIISILNLSYMAQYGLEFKVMGTELKTNIFTKSAWDLIDDGYSDCVTFSYTKQAILDRMGIETVVVISPGASHAYTAILINGSWFKFDGGVDKLELKKLDYISYAPNGGVEIMTKEMQAIYKPVN